MVKQVKDFSPEERQHILEQLEGGLNLPDVAMRNDTTYQTIRAIQRIAKGEAGRRKTKPEERERIWKRACKVGFAQAAAESNLSETTISNWRWRYKMSMPERSDTEASDTENHKKIAYNKVYTPEEKAMILAFARRAGAVDAARKFNVSTTSIRNWTKQAEQQSATQSIQRQLLFQTQEQTQPTQSADQVQEQIVQPSAQEELVSDQKALAMEHGDESVQSDHIIGGLLPEDSKIRVLVARVQELNIEVALLREKNALLTRRVEALKASVINLLSE